MLERLITHRGYSLVGKNATSDFEGMFHSDKARRILEEYFVGVLEVSFFSLETLELLQYTCAHTHALCLSVSLSLCLSVSLSLCLSVSLCCSIECALGDEPCSHACNLQLRTARF
jgi:hypothetical protein